MAYRENCPCCGEVMVDLYETCPVCGWCNDEAAKYNPDEPNLVENEMSLNEARAAWKAKKKKAA